MNIPDARCQRLINAKIRSKIYYQVLDELSLEIANAESFPITSKAYDIPYDSQGQGIPCDISYKLGSYGWVVDYYHSNEISYKIKFKVDISNSRIGWMAMYLISLILEIKYWRHRK